MLKTDSEVLALIDALIAARMTPQQIRAAVKRRGYWIEVEWIRRRMADREIARPREVEPLVSLQTELDTEFRRAVARVGTVRARELVDELERQSAPGKVE